MKKIKPAVLVGLLCMIFSMGIFVQLKTIESANISGAIQLTDSNLKRTLLQWKTTYEESNKKLDETEKKLEDLRNSTLDDNTDDVNKEKIKKYRQILGLTNVSGEGVVVTVADNDSVEFSNSFSNLFISESIVHDGNLVAILNELKAAGAEAISINDKRITETTCITCAGNVIQVNGEKVGSPFVIKAIGDKDLLYGEMSKKQGTLYKLKMYGVVTNISKEDNIDIQKKM